MSSIAQREFVKERNKMASKAKAEAQVALRKQFGEAEGDKRLNALIEGLKRNMITD